MSFFCIIALGDNVAEKKKFNENRVSSVTEKGQTGTSFYDSVILSIFSCI